MFEGQTQKAILERMKGAVPSDLDSREGSFIHDALSPASIELAMAYATLDRVLNLGFAGDHDGAAYGVYLDRRANEHGLTRKPETKATGEVTIIGVPGAIVTAGSLFSTGAGVQFKTTAEVVVESGGTVTVAIEAVFAGAASNVLAGSITQIPVAIAGVTAVTNAAPIMGGTDQETDADLTARLLEKVRLPATSGNKAHYLQWAKEVPGVGAARVTPVWNGPGTVKVVIVDAEKKPAAQIIVDAVAQHIEEMRPIGAAVTVVSASAKVINVSATVVLAAGYTLQQVTDAFTEALEVYFQEVAFATDYISHAKVGTILLSTQGVLDYSGLTLNGGVANVALAGDETPVLGIVELGV